MTDRRHAMETQFEAEVKMAAFLHRENQEIKLKKMMTHPKRLAAQQEREARRAEFEILESKATAREAAAAVAAMRQR